MCAQEQQGRQDWWSSIKATALKDERWPGGLADLRVTCKDQRAVADAPEQMSVAVKRRLEAFNAHDIDVVMSPFSDDHVDPVRKAVSWAGPEGASGEVAMTGSS
jgi:hypothetical protein